MKTPLQILTDARALIDSPEKWTRRVYRRENHDDDTCQHCALGAILYSSGCSELWPAESLLKRGALIAQNDSITAWNDAPERTHAEVLAAFDTAIELARNEEAK